MTDNTKVTIDPAPGNPTVKTWNSCAGLWEMTATTNPQNFAPVGMGPRHVLSRGLGGGLVLRRGIVPPFILLM